MAQFWQDVQTRAQVTFEVWDEFFLELALGATGLTQFEELLNGLPTAAQGRDTAVQALDEARQQLEFTTSSLRLAELGVPKIIEGVIDEESGLLDDLDKVYAVTPWSPTKVVERGQLLGPVWAAANAWQLSRTPPRNPIVRGTTTQALFTTQLEDIPAQEQVEAKAEVDLNHARGDLRRAATALDRLCKRFLSAARGMSDEGTAAADALDTIPTEGASPLPETLGIRTISQGGTGGLQLLLRYEPDHSDSATAKVVQWMVEGVDAGWDHEMTVDPSGNALGPFVVGQVVRVRTKVTNPSGSRESGPRMLMILQPPT